MFPQEYHRMRQYEDDYWWFHGLRTLTTDMFARYCANPRPLVLDAGCGTGGQLAWLRRALPHASLFALDLLPIALQLAQDRGFSGLACASTMQVPFPDDTFDVVTSMDVLYIEGVDDRAALAELRRVLRPGGVLLLNLPALEALRGAHDVAVRTRQRYRRPQVGDLLREGGYRVLLLSYWDTILLPVLAATRWWSRLSPGREAISDFRPLPGWLNVLLKALIGAEVRALDRFSLPIGSSVFAVAQKP